MKSYMVPADHHAAVQRVLLLGRSGDAATLSELIALSKLPSNEVQRLAASAIGKLSGFGADARAAVEALVALALHGRHPQTQQYALRALKPYASAAQAHLHDLRDLASNQPPTATMCGRRRSQPSRLSSRLCATARQAWITGASAAMWP